MKVFVACHDAGGAEIISSWIKRERVEWGGMLDGPAEEIFRRKLGDSARSSTMFGDADLILCGTSVVSAWEGVAWRMAKLDGYRTAVYLDHWKNYQSRFRFNGSVSVPDEVWVTDRFAAALAREELPDTNIVIKGHPYADEVATAVRAMKPAPGPLERILYVAEPRRPEPKRDVLDGLSARPYVYRQRPHPSVAPARRRLTVDLAWATIVIGYDSMAMAIALRCGCRVVSLLRPTETLHIPWTGVERFYA